MAPRVHIDMPPRHALSDVFPRMKEAKYEGLVLSIRTNGFNEDLGGKIIKSADGHIVDGYHRYRACVELGIDPEPYVRVLENDTELAEIANQIVAANAQRRHLSAAAEAMSMLLLNGQLPPEARWTDARIRHATGIKASTLSQAKRALSMDEDVAIEIATGNESFEGGHLKATGERVRSEGPAIVWNTTKSVGRFRAIVDSMGLTDARTHTKVLTQWMNAVQAAQKTGESGRTVQLTITV